MNNRVCGLFRENFETLTWKFKGFYFGYFIFECYAVWSWGKNMAGGNFMHRVISYFVNEVVVNGLANRCFFFLFRNFSFWFMHMIFEVVGFFLWSLDRQIESLEFLIFLWILRDLLFRLCWYLGTSLDSGACNLIWTNIVRWRLI